MGTKKDYRLANSQYLRDLSMQQGVVRLPDGVFYEVMNAGNELGGLPTANSVVTVHYKGSLINGHVFDSSYERTCPEAFRVRDVIEGWQIALQQMRKGDKWKITIPNQLGYGTKSVDDIPGNSTLIFEVELIDFQ
ncbi:MAG: FKBP-type peptidyl-prolyl cis-trans isomerase [Muribaculaceae bacterium]